MKTIARLLLVAALAASVSFASEVPVAKATPADRAALTPPAQSSTQVGELVNRTPPPADTPVLETFVVTAKRIQNPDVIRPPMELDKVKIDRISIKDGVATIKIRIGDFADSEMIYTEWKVSSDGYLSEGLIRTNRYWDSPVKITRPEGLFTWGVEGTIAGKKVNATEWVDFFQRAAPFQINIASTADTEVVLEKDTQGKPILYELVAFAGEERRVVIREVGTFNGKVFSRDEFGVLPTTRSNFQLGRFNGRLVAIQQFGQDGKQFAVIEVPIAKAEQE